MPAGHRTQKTIEKELYRELLRRRVSAQFLPMIDAQITNCLGVRHTFLRDDAGRFVQLTDPKVIEQALNSGAEGKYYWTFTKDPSIQAFADLMNRMLDKPADQKQQLEHSGELTIKHELPD